MSTKLLTSLVFVLALASCTGETSLDARLAGKSKSEQHGILKSECLREGSWKNRRHNQRMADICNRMAAEMK